jgi:hypothetical protein
VAAVGGRGAGNAGNRDDGGGREQMKIPHRTRSSLMLRLPIANFRRA